MALQPVTTTWQQADVDAMVMDGSWLVRCSVCVMCKWGEPTVVSAIRWIPISCELNSAALQAADSSGVTLRSTLPDLHKNREYSCVPLSSSLISTESWINDQPLWSSLFPPKWFPPLRGITDVYFGFLNYVNKNYIFSTHRRQQKKTQNGWFMYASN